MKYTSPPKVDSTPEEAQNTREVPGETFPKFGKLCAELRNKIWEFAVPGARNIFVKENLYPYKNCAPPALLSVCRESRDIALGTLRRCILPDDPQHDLDLRASVYLNINPGVDRLHIIRFVLRKLVVVQVTINEEVWCPGPGKPFNYHTSNMSRFLLDVEAPRGEGKQSTFEAFQLSGLVSEQFWSKFTQVPRWVKVRKREYCRKLLLEEEKQAKYLRVRSTSEV